MCASLIFYYNICIYFSQEQLMYQPPPVRHTHTYIFLERTAWILSIWVFFFLVSADETSEDIHPQQLCGSNREEAICSKMGDPTWFSTRHYPNKNLLSLRWRMFHRCLIFYILLMLLFIHMNCFFFTMWNETTWSLFLWNKHFNTLKSVLCSWQVSVWEFKGIQGSVTHIMPKKLLFKKFDSFQSENQALVFQHAVDV